MQARPSKTRRMYVLIWCEESLWSVRVESGRWVGKVGGGSAAMNGSAEVIKTSNFSLPLLNMG